MKSVYLSLGIIACLSAYSFSMDQKPSVDSILSVFDQTISEQYSLSFLSYIMDPSEDKLMHAAETISSRYPCVDDKTFQELTEKSTYFSQVKTLCLHRMLYNLNKKLTIENVDAVYRGEQVIPGFDKVPSFFHSHCLKQALQKIHKPVQIPVPVKGTPLSVHGIKDSKGAPWFFVHTVSGKLSLWKFNELIWQLPEIKKGECFIKCLTNAKYLISGFILTDQNDKKVEISIWDSAQNTKIHAITHDFHIGNGIADIDYLHIPEHEHHVISIYTYKSDSSQHRVENACFPFIQFSQSCPVQKTTYVHTKDKRDHICVVTPVMPFVKEISIDALIKNSNKFSFSREDDLNLFLLDKSMNQTPVVQINLKHDHKGFDNLAVYTSLLDHEQKFIESKFKDGYLKLY